MQLISTHIVRKSDIGVHDNLFGGELMSWFDIAGAAFAMETCKSDKMVTKKVAEFVFNSPVKVNSLLKIYGDVVRLGNTSITLKIEARRLDPVSTSETIVCTTEMVFVRVNGYGEATPLPDKVKEKFNITQ